MRDGEKLTAARGLTRLLAEALELRPNQAEIEDAIADLWNWKPECGFPTATGVGGEPRDDISNAEFMSEAYLYALLGKEDARTLISKVRRIAELCGVDWRRQQRRSRDPEADVRLEIARLDTAMVSGDEEKIYRASDGLKRALEVLTSW